MRGSDLVAAAAATLFTACATVGEGSKGTYREYKVDEAVALPADGIAPVSLKAGPFEVIEVRVRNMPSEKDVAEDRRGRDTSHPKPTIVARSTSHDVAHVKLVSILEDDVATPLMTCDTRRPQELAPGVTDDWNTCMFEGITTREWPRVKYFHVIATFRVWEETPSAP